MLKPTALIPLSLKTLHSIMSHAPAKYLDPLNAAMTQYEINNGRRIAAFLSQLAVESSELTHTHELWSGKKNFHLSGVKRAAHTAASKQDYFEYWYGGRKDLGNETAGDGYAYRGRGAIQITGRANYRLIGNAIHKPLETQPDLLESDPAIDLTASAYFFARLKNLLPIADQVNPRQASSVIHANILLTKAVNGHHNGLAERLHYFQKALGVLAK